MTATAQLPRLVFFHSKSSGRSRRVEAFIAQVLQRRHNHGTFKVVPVDIAERPDLAERFAIETIPTVLVIDGGRVQARVVDPRGVRDLSVALAPWLN